MMEEEGKKHNYVNIVILEKLLFYFYWYPTNFAPPLAHQPSYVIGCCVQVFGPDYHIDYDTNQDDQYSLTDTGYLQENGEIYKRYETYATGTVNHKTVLTNF